MNRRIRRGYIAALIFLLSAAVLLCGCGTVTVSYVNSGSERQVVYTVEFDAASAEAAGVTAETLCRIIENVLAESGAEQIISLTGEKCVVSGTVKAGDGYIMGLKISRIRSSTDKGVFFATIRETYKVEFPDDLGSRIAEICARYEVPPLTDLSGIKFVYEYRSPYESIEIENGTRSVYGEYTVNSVEISDGSTFVIAQRTIVQYNWYYVALAAGISVSASVIIAVRIRRLKERKKRRD